MLPRYILAVVFTLSMAVACEAAEPQGSKDRSRCDYPVKAWGFFVGMRGTGYYWVEYIHRHLGDEVALLLVRGDRPLFADRVTTSAKELKCENMTILAEARFQKGDLHPIFDCHIADDMPHPLGEVTVGFIEDNEVGLARPKVAYRALVEPSGRGGTISRLDSTTRVLCPVFPGIDE